MIVQCEDLYEPISCLLPEVAASPAPHCTYPIFGMKNVARADASSIFAGGVRPFFVFIFFCLLPALE